MPIPFRDAEDVEELGSAGFLKIELSLETGACLGALFLINARGEPLEFSYSRIETPHTFLWRQEDIRRHAVRKLTLSLLSTCQRVPLLVLCLADEVHNELFANELHLSIPIVRIASPMQATPHSPLEVQDVAEGPEPLNLFWLPGKPSDESVEHRLLSRLAARSLLLEPFERALVGLKEVYANRVDAKR